MSPNDNTNILKKPFMNKDKAEWDTFSSDLVSVMALKKNKLGDSARETAWTESGESAGTYLDQRD